ncbi:hypothetical protein [Xenorhabdus sp. KJ12.1]|uniref:hypothetical protein n=1 Tax=Xenorhabdus sp. KJ12.1 TaxID=1851571 RepID=UPI000C0532B4|nr:hypothetical protein [Xenorhabdus sp. KJ12.1]PHM69513.1 hypothetical protein Xekj_02482 [Xenorhabdus sp. KJ12.1]
MNTESQTITLEAMLEALGNGDTSIRSDNKCELSGLNELEKLSAELEKLDTKDISDAVRIEELPIVEDEIETPVISKPTEPLSESVDLDFYTEEDDLEATLAALSDEIVTDTPSIDPIEPEVKTKPDSQKMEKKSVEQIEKPKKATRKRETVTRPRFQLSDLTVEDCEKLGVTKEAMTEIVDKCPVKAKDKVLNLAQWALRGNELSIYTQLGIECLIKNNTASSEIFRLYMMSNPTRPYPTATAGTQAGQLMAALPALGIADSIGKNVTLRADSPLIRMFKEQFSQ